jgi:hypothetical protein
MHVRHILGNVSTPWGNQVIAKLFNGRYAVGDLSYRSEVPETEQFEDFKQALYKWYNAIHNVRMDVKHQVAQ